jgi:hypothetical protein
MPYTEFYCDTATGSNLNAGDDKPFVITSTNGDWGIAAPNRFTAAFGATPFSSVSVGDFASIYADGATVTGYVGRVTAVNGGGASLDISSTAKSGTAPPNSAILRSCTVGGKWKGPNGTSGFPFGFVAGTMTNVSAHPLRVNFKSGTNYSITAAMTHNVAGPTVFQGYTTTVGDGGKATINGGNTGASYTLLNNTSAGNQYIDLIFANNGATGIATLVSFLSNAGNQIKQCVFTGSRGIGLQIGVDACQVIECESYACNAGNQSTYGAFFSSSPTVFERCIAHDNTGSNTAGFSVTGSTANFIDCISDTNGGIGFNISTAYAYFNGCVSYNNTSDGIRQSLNAAIPINITNCILVKNGGYGINLAGNASRVGGINNCAFGAGTLANTSGQTNAIGAVFNTGPVTLSSNTSPWVEEATGNFRLNSATGGGAACRNAGVGTFTQTAASYSGTLSYPSIGSTEPLVTSGGGGGSSSFIG